MTGRRGAGELGGLQDQVHGNRHLGRGDITGGNGQSGGREHDLVYDGDGGTGVQGAGVDKSKEGN